MRLCYIADGTSIHTKRWVNYFARKGHEVHLISPRFTEGREGFEGRVQMHRLTRLLPRLWKVSRYPTGMLWLIQVRRLLKRIKPDILDAHFVTVRGYLGAISGFHPLVLTAWGSDILVIPKKSLMHRFLSKQALKRADAIVCVSPALREEIIGLGAAPNKVEVTPIGIDTQKFSPARRDEALLRELGAADSPVVISTRNLRPVYDVQTLIRAIPLVLGEVPQARFIIGGDGEQRGYLEGLAQSLGVSASVRFVGWVSNDELPAYLASSDVYVSTSLSDGTSISLLEALACELAPVVSDIPANRPWINEAENGFLVPTRDYGTLAARIIAVLKNRDIRTEFGKVSRRMVVERAEHQNEMSRIERIYEGLIGAKS